MKAGILFIVATLLLFTPHSPLALDADIEAMPPIEPPIAGMRLSDLTDSFDQKRNGHRHEAIDIMVPENTPVHAVADGSIRKLFLSKAGGITIYEFDDAGMYCYYYAHLARYAYGLREGSIVFKGDVIGYVGSSGDAELLDPQLHFEIHLLDPKRWWQGIAVDPYPALVEAVQCTLPSPLGAHRTQARHAP